MLRRSQIARDRAVRRKIDHMLREGRSLQAVAAAVAPHGPTRSAIGRYLKAFRATEQRIERLQATLAEDQVRGTDNAGARSGASDRAAAFVQAMADTLQRRNVAALEQEARTATPRRERAAGASAESIAFIRSQILGLDPPKEQSWKED